MCVGLWGMCGWSMSCVCKVECEILVWVEYKEWGCGRLIVSGLNVFYPVGPSRRLSISSFYFSPAL